MTARFYCSLRHVVWLCRHSCHQFPLRRCTYALLGILLCSLSLLGGPVAVYAQDDVTDEETEPTRTIAIVDGYEYAVQPGETWSLVSSRTGVDVSVLQEANPAPTRRGYLRVGERLSVPVRIATTTHVVQRGESWSIVAQDYGISQQLLRAFNPVANRYGDVLRLNDTLTIPLPDEPVPAEEAATEAVDAEVATAEEAGTETGTPSATDETAAATPTVEETAADEADATAETAPQETATPEAVATPLPACPTSAEAYPALLLDLLNNSAGNADIISTLLVECGVMDDGSVTTRDFTGDEIDDFVIVYAAPTTDTTTDATADNTADETAGNTVPQMDLLIIDSSATDGNPYQIGHQARAESAVQLLSTVDINSDAQPDVVWAETTCGADDCFQTLQVYSWDGTAWQNWTESRVTLANAELALEDVDERGSGFELVLEGGIYEGPDAGPQRGTVVIWGSLEGAPYTVLETQVAASDCLYHAVIDGNAAFLNGATDNFAAAEQFYSPAVADNTLRACGDRPNELAELRSFSIFRLALVAAYRGQPTIAADLITGLEGSFPDSIYHTVGQIWLAEYQNSYDIASACAAVTSFAEANPEAVAVLADYGYANPPFTATDLCPILDIEVPLPSVPPAVDVPADEATAVEPAATDGATAETASEDTSTATETISETATAEEATTAEDTAAEEAAAEDTAAEDAAAEETAAQEAAAEDTVNADAEPTALPTMDDGLPTCPDNLAGYAAELTTMLDVAAGDPLIIETWLRFCDAMNDEAEAFVLADLNGDALSDALFLPTIISDRGVGPEGAQGAVLLYHGTGEGGYELVANPQIYGKPSLLAVEDLNADGQTDIAWTVEGCATFCVSEVQIVSWQNGVYTDTIAPGALIAEGTATFTDLPAASIAQGKQLVLEGGVSGTADGGLAVPHTEIWQSIGGAPFERVSWTYARQVEGSECMGLRLVEADVAMQAAPLLGYGPAIERYTASIDPSLAACSLYGTEAEEELQLLQGLATFRLIQAHALAGDLDTANEILGGIVRGLPDSDYTQAAEAWLTAYTADADAALACDEVTDIFVDNTELWQITDHYGYNHPALAAEQICYVPK